MPKAVVLGWLAKIDAKIRKIVVTMPERFSKLHLLARNNARAEMIARPKPRLLSKTNR